MPSYDVGEEVSLKGGVIFEEIRQVQGALCRDELVQTHLNGRQLGPFLLRVPVARVWTGVTDTFEDHRTILQAPCDPGRWAHGSMRQAEKYTHWMLRVSLRSGWQPTKQP